MHNARGSDPAMGYPDTIGKSMNCVLPHNYKTTKIDNSVSPFVPCPNEIARQRSQAGFFGNFYSNFIDFVGITIEFKF
jgi:hypothetical protein